MACRLPLYDPISLSLAILSRTFRRKSVSMVIDESFAVMAVIVLLGNEPTLARGKMENFARSRDE